MENRDAEAKGPQAPGARTHEPHGRGLGHLFDSGKISADYPLMFAVLIALAVLGILLYYVIVALERIFAGWAERAET